jgi:hypothetical protein
VSGASTARVSACTWRKSNFKQTKTGTPRIVRGHAIASRGVEAALLPNSTAARFYSASVLPLFFRLSPHPHERIDEIVDRLPLHWLLSHWAIQSLGSKALALLVTVAGGALVFVLCGLMLNIAELSDGVAALRRWLLRTS